MEYITGQRRITRRWHLTLCAWLEEEWNHPSRTDYQIMRVAQVIREFNQSFAKSPKAVKLEDMQVKFSREGDETQTMTLEEATALSKAKWGVLGRKRK